MSLALVCITDGRKELFARGLASLHYVEGTFTQIVCADDSADPEYADWLHEQLPMARIVHHGERQGLAAAIRSAWSLLDLDDLDYVLHLEDDIEFTAPISVREWAHPFTVSPYLAQVCLLRDAQSPEEIAAGGIIPLHSRTSPPVAKMSKGTAWLEHDWYFSLQPSLYPRWIVKQGWPEHGGETEFTQQLLRCNPLIRFVYLDAEPVYDHIGHARRSAGWTV